jgi:hypothetical protein
MSESSAGPGSVVGGSPFLLAGTLSAASNPVSSSAEFCPERPKSNQRPWHSPHWRQRLSRGSRSGMRVWEQGEQLGAGWGSPCSQFTSPSAYPPSFSFWAGFQGQQPMVFVFNGDTECTPSNRRYSHDQLIRARKHSETGDDSGLMYRRRRHAGDDLCDALRANTRLPMFASVPNSIAISQRNGPPIKGGPLIAT